MPLHFQMFLLQSAVKTGICSESFCTMSKQAPLTAESHAMDETDLAILRELQADGRITIKDLAARVHLSPTPVHERVRRLERAGIITGYTALLDAAKVGRGLLVVCHVSLKEHSKTAGTRFIKAINSWDEVLECLTVSGQFDFLLKLAVADMNAYYDFHVNKLSALDNVGSVQSEFVMGIVKQTQRLV